MPGKTNKKFAFGSEKKGGKTVHINYDYFYELPSQVGRPYPLKTDKFNAKSAPSHHLAPCSCNPWPVGQHEQRGEWHWRRAPR